MNILLLHQDWFATELRQLGHAVVTCGYAEHLQVKIKQEVVHLDTILDLLPSGFIPDLIVVHDNSTPPLLVGLEKSRALTLFYSVDTHHHAQFHRGIAALFDGVLVAQSGFIDKVRESGVPIEWMPLWASRTAESQAEKLFDAIFVGNVERTLHPERADFFETLEKKVPLTCTQGEFWKLFPQARVVLNQTVKGDLNFRVFEALGCGAALLTERSGNGLVDLFQDGVHLRMYNRGDVEQAARIVHELLSDSEQRNRLAASGQQEVMSKHRAIHRAEQLLNFAAKLPRRTGRSNLSGLCMLGAAARYLDRVNSKNSLKALEACAEYAAAAVRANETLTPDVAGFAVICANRLGRLSTHQRGEEMIAGLQQAYSDQLILHLGRINSIVADGRRDDALGLARSVLSGDPERALQLAVDSVASLEKNLESLER